MTKKHHKKETIKTLLGWTFFDPCNLLCIILLFSASVLAFNEFKGSTAEHLWTIIIYYACVASYLRTYFYRYYYGTAVKRIMIYVPLMLAIVLGSAYWYDSSTGFAYLDGFSLKNTGRRPALYWASLLHLMSAISITCHLLMPRGWLIKITDDIESSVPEDLGVGPLTERDTEG